LPDGAVRTAPAGQPRPRDLDVVTERSPLPSTVDLKARYEARGLHRPVIEAYNGRRTTARR
jgi:hypothetical protein